MTRSIELYPERVDYLRNRSLAFRNAGRMSQAVADATRVIELALDEGYIQRASLYAIMEEYSSARNDLNLFTSLGYQLSEEEKIRIMSLNKGWRNR